MLRKLWQCLGDPVASPATPVSTPAPQLTNTSIDIAAGGVVAAMILTVATYIRRGFTSRC